MNKGLSFSIKNVNKRPLPDLKTSALASFEDATEKEAKKELVLGMESGDIVSSIKKEEKAPLIIECMPNKIKVRASEMQNDSKGQAKKASESVESMESITIVSGLQQQSNNHHSIIKQKQQTCSNHHDATNNIENAPDNNNQANSKSENDVLELRARQLILMESVGELQSNNDNTSSLVVIQMPKKRTKHLHADDNQINTQEYPEPPTLDDYERVTVFDFADAMLRGMGASEERLKNDTQVEVQRIRPKGLGLGADIPEHRIRPMINDEEDNFKQKNGEGSSKRKRYLPGQDDDEMEGYDNGIQRRQRQEDELVDPEIRSGSLVYITAGKHTGCYGIVESVNEHLAYCDVKLTLAKTVEQLPEACLRPVSRKEYGVKSKILNQTQVDEYNRKKAQLKLANFQSFTSSSLSSSSLTNDKSHRADNQSDRNERADKHRRRRDERGGDRDELDRDRNRSEKHHSNERSSKQHHSNNRHSQRDHRDKHRRNH